MSDHPLTELELRILEFEKRVWKLAGAKESAIRDEFRMRWVEYYRLLAYLIERSEAERHDAQLVRRLRRQRDQVISRKYVRGRAPEEGDQYDPGR